MAHRTDDWRWKVPGLDGSRQPKLLYEPGNWGDILKGTWAVIVARALAEALGNQPLRYLDPFAGQPTYPLLESTASRLRWLRSGVFLEAQRDWLERGALAGTALLVRETASRRVPPVLEVCDAEPSYRERWLRIDGVQLIEIKRVEDTLRAARCDLILVDPYDLFDRFEELLPSALAAARSATVLLYLYNKSPRGGGYARNYKALRRRLAQLSEGRAVLLGRTPADIILPRAFHEVILVGPAELLARVEGELRRGTRLLACRMAVEGVFEREGGR